MHNILFFLLSDMIGGGEQYARTLIRHLPPDSFQATVLTLPGPVVDFISESKPLAVPWGKPMAKYRGLSLPGLVLARPRLIARLQQLIDNQRFNLAFMQYLKEKILFTRYFHRKSIPVIWTEHGILPYWIVHNPLLRKAYRNAAEYCRAIIAISQAGRDSLLRLGIPDSKITVIHNGIDVSRFAADDDCHDPLVIGTMSSLTSAKGITDFLTMAKIMIHCGQPVKFEIAGTGPLSRRVRDFCDAHPRHCRYHGFSGNPEQFLKLIDIFLNPSRGMGEGLPLRILEAMAAGRIVVSTDTGAAREVIIHGDNGFLVKPRQPAAWIDLLRPILAAPQSYAPLRRRAAQRVRDHFTHHRMLAETFKVFAGYS